MYKQIDEYNTYIIHIILLLCIYNDYILLQLGNALIQKKKKKYTYYK